MMNKAMYSSAAGGWNTPESLLRFVKIFCGGRIALDPCSNRTSLTGAHIELRQNDDGLISSWRPLADRARLAHYLPIPTVGVISSRYPFNPAENIRDAPQEKRRDMKDEKAGWLCWRPIVFCNPPYGRTIPLWADKIVESALDGAEVISLVPARTDAKWFQLLMNTCQRVCFVTGRIKFSKPGVEERGALLRQTMIHGCEHVEVQDIPTASAPFPSAIFLHDTSSKFTRHFEVVFGTPVFSGDRACGIVCEAGNQHPF